MKRYEIINNEGRCAIYSTDESAFFAGYDFMGGVNWEKIPTAECLMDRAEAEQIAADLEAADEPEDPAKKQYMVQIRSDGETYCFMMTGRELADRYEYEQEIGIGEEYAAFDVSTFGAPVAVNVYDLTRQILEQKRCVEQEYRDYCEAVNEYGYDFEGRD